MKKFVKGNISTFVEDDDRRIEQYLKNGWKEEKLPEKPATAADKRMKQAIEDVAGSKKGKRKIPHDDKQTNEAIASSETAAAEGAPVDDGLFKKEGA